MPDETKPAAEPIGRMDTSARQTAEQWRDARVSRKTTHAGGFSAADAYLMAKTLHGWPVGVLVSEPEYDAAVAAALNLEVR